MSLIDLVALTPFGEAAAIGDADSALYDATWTIDGSTYVRAEAAAEEFDIMFFTLFPTNPADPPDAGSTS